MATVFSHALVGGIIAATLAPPKPPTRYWLLAATCAVLPDADVIAFPLGIPYSHVLGHRGLSHSLPFAALLSLLIVTVAFRAPPWRAYRRRLLLVYFLATASHGILDAMTNGGLGIAFLAPFSDTRSFLPVRPLLTSPISPRRFISWYGVAVLRSELVWIWLPGLILGGVLWLRRHSRPRSSCGEQIADVNNSRRDGDQLE